MTEVQEDRVNELTRGSLLARNTFLNLIGYIAPLAVAVLTVPLIIRGLGTERFGVLTLMWVLIGYLSLMDMGLSRALTKIIAEKLGEGKDTEIPGIIRTAMAILLCLGIVLTVAGILLLPWLVKDVLNIPGDIENETLRAFRLLIIFSPVVILSIGLRGVLDAFQRFDMTNAVRIPLGIYSFLSPLAVFPFSKSLFPVVCVLLIGRICGFFAHLFFCFRAIPGLGRGLIFQREMVGPLIRFGGWMSVSNIISPIMVYLDRFLIGAMVSAAAVAYYAIPNEFVTKVLIIPGAMIGVLFPAFSASFTHERGRTKQMFGRGIKYIFILLFPVTFLIVALAGDGLRLWLGPEFSQNSTRVLQWLAVGVFFNSIAHVPFTLIQGAGRPDLTAWLHLAELPVYLASLWWMIGHHGIEGAAIAWAGRMAVDALWLLAISCRLLGIGFKMFGRHIIAALIGITAFYAAGALPAGFHAKGIFFCLAAPIYFGLTWFTILSPEERQFIGSRARISH